MRSVDGVGSESFSVIVIVIVMVAVLKCRLGIRRPQVDDDDDDDHVGREGWDRHFGSGFRDDFIHRGGGWPWDKQGFAPQEGEGGAGWAGMVKVVLPEGQAAWAARLEQAGLAWAFAARLRPPRLDVATADEVWMIPEALLVSSDWARLRVELGEAPRFFVVATGGVSTRSVVAAMRDGAFDVVSAGDEDARWRGVVESAAESQRLWLRLYGGTQVVEGSKLVGRSLKMDALRRDLERLGPTDVTVLLMGESGVGKERVAVALHEAGRGGTLVTLNCAAMPRELVEAELFGAEKGAYTGALRTRPGLVEQAAGGTLFLDEVGELDLGLQPKLLRFLETRRARRVGGEAEYAVALRVVAATNRDLEVEVREGRFRADLYYRLAEVVLRLPPLRERKDDIPGLVRVFMAGAAERFGKHFDTLEPELLLRWQEYDWPGNVRELKSVVDRLVLFHDGPVLRSGWWQAPGSGLPVSGGPDRPEVLLAAPGPAGPAGGGTVRGWGETTGPGWSGFPHRRARRELAQQLLAEGRWSLAEVAARVGVHPTTLFRWRKSGNSGDSGGGSGDGLPGAIG